MTNLDLSGRLSTPTLLARRQILPEESVVDMATPVEVDQGLQSNLGLDILLLFCSSELLRGRVEAVDVGLVVVLEQDKNCTFLEERVRCGKKERAQY
jgi:hypothetical protein